MPSDLFQKWLAHYDPIHRGYTPAGIANGLTVTGGCSFPRIGGGYNLYRGADGVDSIDYANPVGAAAGEATAISNFPWRAHAASTTYVYVVRSIGGGGVESSASHPARVAEFDDGGVLVGLRPNSPSEVAVSGVSGGRFQVRWSYSSLSEEAAPSVFAIYHDDGTGVVDYETTVATVAYRRGRVHYAYTSQAFSHDVRRIWGVRAISASGVDDGNQYQAMGWADAEGPAAHPAVGLWRLGEE